MKQCPFCGGEAVMTEYPHLYVPSDYAVRCKVCDARMGLLLNTQEAAADAWNRRADTATECQPYYQPKLPRNYKPDEDSMRRRDKLFSDMEQLGIKHNPDGSMEVVFKQKEGHNG